MSIRGILFFVLLLLLGVAVGFVCGYGECLYKQAAGTEFNQRAL